MDDYVSILTPGFVFHVVIALAFSFLPTSSRISPAGPSVWAPNQEGN